MVPLGAMWLGGVQGVSSTGAIPLVLSSGLTECLALVLAEQSESAIGDVHKIRSRSGEQGRIGI